MPTRTRRVGDKERGFHNSTKEGGPLKPIKNLLHNGELTVGPISTQFEEEEESEESETSDVEVSTNNNNVCIYVLLHVCNVHVHVSCMCYIQVCM